MKRVLRTTLLMFYSDPSIPLNGCICLNDNNKLPSIIVKTEITSKEISKNFFHSITGIDKNWGGVKIIQANVEEYKEEGEKIIDINYLILLQGEQKLTEGYKWVKIKDIATCGLPEDKIKSISIYQYN